MTIINPVTIKIFRARNPKKIRIQAKQLAKAETKRTLNGRHDTELPVRRVQFQTVFTPLLNRSDVPGAESCTASETYYYYYYYCYYYYYYYYYW